MSVALRSSSRGSLGTLRRTASLEYFLDIDKECNVEEVELPRPPPPSQLTQVSTISSVDQTCFHLDNAAEFLQCSTWIKIHLKNNNSQSSMPKLAPQFIKSCELDIFHRSQFNKCISY